MLHLTSTVPKALLKVGGKLLIEYHLENLARANFKEIVINCAYLGDVIERTLGTGEAYGVQISYSPESVALETAGGINNALPLLTDRVCNQPFLVINADIYCEMNFSVLLPIMVRMRAQPEGYLAHLVLVDNPVHHLGGDFALHSGQVSLAGDNRLTFSGIGIYQPALFANMIPNKAIKLAPLLRQAIEQKQISGQHYAGNWVDVGTPERLDSLNC